VTTDTVKTFPEIAAVPANPYVAVAPLSNRFPAAAGDWERQIAVTDAVVSGPAVTVMGCISFSLFDA
jgi:hypothetical protein